MQIAGVHADFSAHTPALGCELPCSLEQGVVVHGVVRSIHQQVLAVHTERRALGDVRGERLDGVAGEYREGRAVLATHHDGLRFALPQIPEALADVVEPGCAGDRIAEANLVGQLSCHIDDAVLREDHRATDMEDVVIAEANHHHRGVLVGTLRVVSVEAVVAREAERHTINPIDDLAFLGVGGHGAGDAADRAAEFLSGHRHTRAAGEGKGGHDERDEECRETTKSFTQHGKFLSVGGTEQRLRLSLIISL